MKRFSLLALAPLLASAALSGQAPAAAPAPPPVTVLRAARLFTGTGDRVIENAVVVIEGSKIKAVGAGIPAPAGAKTVDLGDATLLAGFIDSHTHLTGEASDSWLSDFYQGLRRPATEQTLWGAVYARRTLEAGFTTVRNVGAERDEDVGLRNGIAKGLVPGPRMLVSRYALGATGGHCDNTGFPEGTFGAEPGPERGILHGANEGRQAVRLQIKYGADVIKMCASGGVLSLGDDVSAPQMTDEELAAVIDESHRLGRKTAAHSHGDLAARSAVRAGIDSIEHGSFMTEETLRLMKEKGTFLVPTVMAGEWTGGKLDRFPPEIAAKAKAAFATRTPPCSSRPFRSASRSPSGPIRGSRRTA